MQDVNRLKLVLVEQKKTSKWLSEELGVSPSTVSKWCTNSSQPESIAPNDAYAHYYMALMFKNGLYVKANRDSLKYYL